MRFLQLRKYSVDIFTVNQSSELHYPFFDEYSQSVIPNSQPECKLLTLQLFQIVDIRRGICSLNLADYLGNGFLSLGVSDFAKITVRTCQKFNLQALLKFLQNGFL